MTLKRCWSHPGRHQGPGERRQPLSPRQGARREAKPRASPAPQPARAAAPAPGSASGSSDRRGGGDRGRWLGPGRAGPGRIGPGATRPRESGAAGGAAAAPRPAPPAWRSAVTDAHLIRPAAGTAQRRSHPPPAAGEGAAPPGRGKVKLQQQSCSPSAPPNLPRPPGGWAERGAHACLTLLDALEADGVLAVLDHGQHIPDGEPGHRGLVHLQQQLLRHQLAAALIGHLAGLHFPQVGELPILGAPLQLEAQLSLRVPHDHDLVDSARPVAFFLQALGHCRGDALPDSLPAVLCFFPPSLSAPSSRGSRAPPGRLGAGGAAAAVPAGGPAGCELGRGAPLCPLLPALADIHGSRGGRTLPARGCTSCRETGRREEGGGREAAGGRGRPRRGEEEEGCRCRCRSEAGAVSPLPPRLTR